jgi:hypothetical protein
VTTRDSIKEGNVLNNNPQIIVGIPRGINVYVAEKPM